MIVFFKKIKEIILWRARQAEPPIDAIMKKEGTCREISPLRVGFESLPGYHHFLPGYMEARIAS